MVRALIVTLMLSLVVAFAACDPVKAQPGAPDGGGQPDSGGGPCTSANECSAPLGVCAEKSALVSAVAAGYRPGDIVAIGITASPCGGCRQWLHEFRVGEVAYRRSDGEVHTATPSELLPDIWDF